MNKDSQLFKMVENEIKRRYESAEEEEIKQILGKRPVSRILKDEQIRPFDEIKRELETKIEQQNYARKKKQEQCVRIQRISFAPTKTIKELQLRSQNIIQEEELKSKLDIKKSLRCLKNMDQLNIDLKEPQDSQFQTFDSVQLNSKFKNNKLKLFLKDSDIKILCPYFENQHQMEFQNSTLDQNELEKRGQILAKLSLLQIFESQVYNLEQKERIQDEFRMKMSEMEGLKQEAQLQRKKQEKAKEAKNIPESELLSQAKEILRRLEVKINESAKYSFDCKDFDSAVKYKRQLQTLRYEIDARPQGIDKLRFLIEYKIKMETD